MTKLVDKFIFYALGICTLFIYGINRYSVIVLLGGLIFSCLYYIWEEKNYVSILPCLYFVICLKYPDFLAFVPLVMYDVFSKRIHWQLIVFILPWFMNLFTAAPLFLMMVSILSIIALIFKKRSLEHQKIDEAYRQQRDQSQEISMLLKKQNKDILLQKDYEVELAILSERNRIAREIHDNAGHSLSSSLLQVGAMQVINQQDSLKLPLSNLKNTLSESLESIRVNVHNMQDNALDLELTMSKLIKEYTKYHIDFTYDIYQLEDIKLKYALISILKEAMHNVYKHSDATNIEIILREQPVFYQFVIRDDGHISGINDNGMGLKNMRERIEQYKGYINFNIENGFEIFITIPKGEH